MADNPTATAALRAWLIEQLTDPDDQLPHDAAIAEAVRRCPDPYNCGPCQGLLSLFDEQPGYDPRWVNPDV